MKATLVILLVAAASCWGPNGRAQNKPPPPLADPAPPAPAQPAETPERKPTVEPPAAATPAAAEKDEGIRAHDLPLEIIRLLAQQAQLEIEIDPRIQQGLDAAGNPLPNWSEEVSERWENTTAEQALTQFLGRYRMVLVANEATKTQRVTYPPAAKSAQPAETKAAEPAAKTAAAESGVEAGQKIEIQDEVVLTAIRTLARLANLNIQFDPRIESGVDLEGKPASMLTNTVSVHWENVLPKQALESLLSNRGLMLVRESNSPIANITFKPTREPPITRVIQLKYSSPTNIVNVLKSTFTNEVNVKEDIRTSSLIVQAQAKNFEAIEIILAQLDVPTKQVLIEAQILETAKNPTSIKGVDWTESLSKQSLTFGPGRKDTTTTQGQPTTVPGPGGRPVTVPGTTTQSSTYTYNPSSSSTLLATASELNPNFAFLNASGLKAVLSFLNTDTDSRTLATPRAVTLDNQETRLEVTRAIPIFDASEAIGQGGTSISSSKPNYTNVGTILIVTPRITGSNIFLNIKPEISAVVDISKKTIAGKISEAEIFGQTKISTQVLIPSGNTLVMGGLKRDSSTKNFTKVPLLGDLPLLGWAFRKESKSRDKQNLLIFVTPTIVQDADFQPTVTDFFQTTRPVHSDNEESAWDSGKPYDWKSGLAPINPK